MRIITECSICKTKQHGPEYNWACYWDFDAMGAGVWAICLPCLPKIMAAIAKLVGENEIGPSMGDKKMQDKLSKYHCSPTPA